MVLAITVDEMQAALERVMGLAGGNDEDKFLGQEIDGLQTLTEYQGMNAKLIAAYIIRTADIKNRTLTKDLALMIAFLCERGSKISHILQKSTPAGKARLEELMTIYDLKSNVSKTSFSVTLARVGAAFPHLTCKYMTICKNPTVSTAQLDDTQLLHVYPRCMMTSAFASLIPDDASVTMETMKLLINAHAYHQLKFSIIVNRKNEQKRGISMKEWGVEVLSYIASASNADFIPSANRVLMLIDLGILNNTGAPVNPAMLTHFATKFLNSVA